MIGTGYVGLVSGVCFSDLGNDVICVDKDIDKIQLLQNGKVPIYEPGLDLIVKRCRNRNLHFSTNIAENIASLMPDDCELVWDTSKPSGDKKRLMNTERAKSIGINTETSLKSIEGLSLLANILTALFELILQRSLATPERPCSTKT